MENANGYIEMMKAQGWKVFKRLSWRTKADQFYQSAGCGQTHVIKFTGNCESCGRSVYSHGCIGAKPCGDLTTDSPDPRGIIPAAHCLYLYHAREYDLVGRDLVTCYDCSQDGDRYRVIMAQAEASGVWKAYEQNNCDGSGPHSSGEVRVMPTGGGGNLILCRRCWENELSYRRDRNKILGAFAQFALPAWNDSEVYETSA